jgi:hypothetical protein
MRRKNQNTYPVGKGDPPQTKEIVETRPFDSNKKLSSLHRQYIRGCDINRYKIIPTEQRFLKYGIWLAEPRPSADFDAPQKIVVRQTGDSLIAAIDSSKYLCLNNIHVLIPNNNNFSNPLFLLGIINSKLMNWYYHTLNPEIGEALAEVKKTHVAKLPIKEYTPSEKQHVKIVFLVTSMLSLNKKLPLAHTGQEKTVIQRQIDSTDRRIDELVYELYGLTQEEIRIVDGTSDN